MGVSVDTVRRWTDENRFASTRSASGQRLIDGADLARFLQQQPVLPGAVTSARNHFAGIVIAVVKDKVAAKVELQAGPYRIVSLMTREAADELGLAPGVAAVAEVKSTNVVVSLANNR